MSTRSRLLLRHGAGASWVFHVICLIFDLHLSRVCRLAGKQLEGFPGGILNTCGLERHQTAPRQQNQLSKKLRGLSSIDQKAEEVIEQIY